MAARRRLESGALRLHPAWAYDEAVHALFGTLDWLEERLSRRRWLVGNALTEADIRLFTTLVRFDAVYVGHFKCNIRRLVDYPTLWAYARDIFTGARHRANGELRAHPPALLREPPLHQPDRHRAGRTGTGLSRPA